MAKTLLELRTMVRRRADMQDDGNFISDTEVDEYINDSIAVLYSLLTDGTNGTLFAKNATVLPKLGDNCYQLPGDFSQLIDISIHTGGTYIRSIEADPQDYAQYTEELTNPTLYTSRYFLQWNVEQDRFEIYIFPAPNNANDIACRYIPEPPQLSLDSDTLNLPTFWYQWVVFDAAIQCLNKEESDPSALMAERDKVEKRVRDHIRSMGVSTVKTIRKPRMDYRHRLPPINYS
jgi:hypothetical protein